MSFEKESAELQERVLTYIDKIRTNEIPACQKMKWSVDRFIHDYKRTNDSDYPYWVDWNELLKFYRWAKLFKHSKGKLAGQPIELMDHQLYEALNILGFKRKENNTRRFREVYIQKARKNAKTQFLALLSSYVAFLSQDQEEVYIAGWIRDQSKLCYSEIVNQIDKADLLNKLWKESYGQITVKSNGSIIKPLSREARKRGDGTNPSLAVIDEYGTAHETNEIVDAQKSGMMARPQPLIVYITTAGFDLTYPCYSYYQYCSDILNPNSATENDDIFVAIYELDAKDNIKDENNWIKANPIVATYDVGINSLRSSMKVALDQPEELRNFLTKNMNLWVDQKEDGFISLEKWNKTVLSDDDFEEFMKGANVYFGIDLSSTTDLTSIGYVAVKAGKFCVGQVSFMPEDKFRERISKDKIRFDLFQERGELVLTDGSIVDYSDVREHLKQLASRYGCKQVGFDQWNATHLSYELANGDGFEMVEVPQSIVKLSEPTKGFKEKLYDGKLFHRDDHLLQWSMGNAIIQSDQNENIKISKKHSKDRIDPVAAIINAYSLAMFDDQVVDLNSVILADDWSF